MSGETSTKPRKFGRRLFSDSTTSNSIWGKATAKETVQNDTSQKKLKRASSIFDLFSKPKVERARGFHDAQPTAKLPATVEAAAAPEQEQDTAAAPSEQSPTEVFTRPDRGKRASRLNLLLFEPSVQEIEIKPSTPPVIVSDPEPKTSPEADKTAPSPPSTAPGAPTLPSLDLTPASDGSPTSSAATTVVAQPAETTSVPQRTASTVKSSSPPLTLEQQRIRRQDEPWDPAPLFQAYPQSIIHGNLQAVSSSTESQLRAQQNNQSMQFAQSSNRTTSSTVISETPYLMAKIFVLVTAGRLVQYPATGKSDRMPERILQLGPRSAAFACDLIPGKHWVVQVIQDRADLTSINTKSSTSLFSRFRMPMLSRKNATSLLMIFKSADDMEAWLKALRQSIHSVGGPKPHVDVDPESKGEREKEARVQKRLSSMPSHRYLVNKNSQTQINRRDSASPLTSSPYDAKRMSLAPSTISTERESVRSKRLSSAPSLGGTSPNLAYLEPLKETSRFSSSASTRTSRTSEHEIQTAATSICSSSPSSPIKDGVNNLDSPPTSTSALSIITNSPVPSSSGPLRRNSLQIIPAMSPTSPGSVRRLSVIAAPPLIDTSPKKRQSMPFINSSDSKVLTKQIFKSPTIPETDSERTSMDFSRTNSGRYKARSNSGASQIPGLPRSQSRSEASRPRPFVRPIPVRPAGTTHRLSVDTKIRIDREKGKDKENATKSPDEELSPIQHLEKLASELQAQSALYEARSREALDAMILNHHRMSVQSTSTTASQEFHSRSRPNSTFIPERRSSIQVTSSRSQSMNQTQPAASSRAQSIRSVRPASMQVRSDQASFLSSRGSGRANSAMSRRSQSPTVPEASSGLIPLMIASQSAAPAPFIPYSRKPPSETSITSSILHRDHQRFSIRSTPSPVPAPVPMPLQMPVQMQMPVPVPATVTPHRYSGIPQPMYRSNVLHPSTSQTSLKAHVEKNPELEQIRKLSRVSSTSYSNPPRLRTSWSAADINAAQRPNQSHPANTSAKRLSHVNSTSKLRSRSPPPQPASNGGSSRNSLILEQVPPAIPPRNVNRTVLRGKHSLPNMAVGLPPPMPPPSCPLPRIPSGYAPNGTT